MRYSIVVLLALVIAAAGAAIAGDVVATSTIRTVTVFRDRAQVERDATARVSRGENVIVLHDLTNDIIDESVRVTGSGSSETAIVEVKVEPDYVEQVSNSDIQDLQASLDSLNELFRRQNDRASVLATERDFLLALKPAPGVQQQGPRMSVKEFQELVLYVAHALADIADQTREIELTKGRLQEKIAVITKRQQDLRSQSNKNLKRVLVVVNASSSGTAHLTVSYVVTRASWAPLYDARVNTTKREISWGYFGVVRQETGENWDDVSLTLSTARPSQGTDIPELAAWYIAQEVPPSAMYKARRTSGANSGISLRGATSADVGESASFNSVQTTPVAVPMTVAEADVEDQQLSSTFTIESPMNVPSDGKPHKASIVTRTLNAVLEYVTVPRVTHDVFLRARAANTSGVPFRAGSANIFVDNQFITTTNIPTIVVGDSLDLALGTTEAVKAERRLINKVQEYAGLLSKTYKWNYEYLTTITNNGKSAVTIAVKDQIPLSQNERIVIEKTGIQPTPATTSDAGVMTWNWALNAGEKKEIRVKYAVEYPRDMHVTGME